jgi:Ni,Fe-hydrogenase I small subunit
MKNIRALTRREFLQIAGAGGIGLTGISLLGIPGFSELFAASVAEIPIVWLQAGCFTGCSVSLLNSVSPTIQDLLLGEVIPGKHLSLAYHPTVMAGQGDQVIDVLDRFAQSEPGGFVLVVEGSISTKDNGIYCEVGDLIGGLSALDLDAHGRSKVFYGALIHDNCQYRGYFDESRFAEDFSHEGCLYALGCRGPETHADCPLRKWNNAVSWCIGSGSPCIGCVEPGFPYKKSLLNT